MELIHRKGEIKRYEEISRFSKGKILNMGSWGSKQHDHLKSRHREVYSADLTSADFIVDLDKDFTKKDFRGNKFDTIIAAEVIEHLESPYNFIKKCKPLLNPKGRIIITAPNATSLQHILRPKWGTSNKIFISPEGHKYKFHISTFTLPMLASIAEMHGFRIIYANYINAFWANPLPYFAASFVNRLKGDIIIVGEKLD